MIDSKICKGVGKAAGSGCGKMVAVIKYGKANRKFGLGLDCRCYSTWLQTTDVGKELLSKHTLNATKTTREFKEFEKEEKTRKSLSWLLKNTVIACHEYIRLRDKGKACISCQEPYNSGHQAGHYYKAEKFSNIKFNEFNINGQCVGCNIRKDGNESEYRVHLPKRIGLENVQELDRLSKEYKILGFKWDREKLIETRKYYLTKIKELK